MDYCHCKIGEIRQRRLAATPRITQEELASLAGIDAAAVSMIETGVTKDPGFHKVLRIFAALNRLEAERAEAAGKEANNVTG